VSNTLIRRVWGLAVKSSLAVGWSLNEGSVLPDHNVTELASSLLACTDSSYPNMETPASGGSLPCLKDCFVEADVCSKYPTRDMAYICDVYSSQYLCSFLS
jgi:hypothetical protein